MDLQQTKPINWWHPSRSGTLLFSVILKQKKARLLARLEGTQKALCRGLNPFLNKLELYLIEFTTILDQEALFWKQKSRFNWMQKKDSKTKIFHLTLVIRRRRNRIEILKKNDGAWVEEAEGIKAMAVEYFLDLFTATPNPATNISIPTLFPGIPTEGMIALVKAIDLGGS